MEITEASRGLYVGLMLALPAIAAVNALVHGSQLRAFLQRTPAFTTYQNIVDFEKVVARQMYAALLQIGLLVSPGIVFVIGLVRGALDINDVLFVILPALVIGALGMAFKVLENTVRAIPADDPILEERRDHIVRVWNRKPFPDW
jgi:hypothetical protein